MPDSSRYFERSIPIGFLTGFIAMLCCLLAGCGGSSTPPPPIPIPALNGNFSISSTSTGTPGFRSSFQGAIQTDSAGHVTGIVHIQGSFLVCFGLALDLPLTGTIDSTGHLNATITGSGDQTVTLNAAVSPNGALLSDGSYSGSGTGCVGGDHGTVTGFQVQPFTGTYSTSFTPSPSTNMGLSLVLTQSAAPDSHGTFALSASTITVTGGAACGFSSAKLIPEASVMNGIDMELLLLGSDELSIMEFIGVTSDGSANLARGQVLINSGPCGGQNALANLSRQ
jgi:hypothetical protein